MRLFYRIGTDCNDCIPEETDHSAFGFGCVLSHLVFLVSMLGVYSVDGSGGLLVQIHTKIRE